MHLLVDAFENAADSFAVITNDSDLVPPMRMLAERGRSVALVSVAGDRYNKAFASIGLDTVRQIRVGTLESSQFPASLIDRDGRLLRKPPQWV